MTPLESFLLGLLAGWLSVAGGALLIVILLARHGRKSTERALASLEAVKGKAEEIASRATLAAARTKGEH